MAASVLVPACQLFLEVDRDGARADAGATAEAGLATDATVIDASLDGTADALSSYAAIVLEDRPHFYLRLSDPSDAGMAADFSGNDRIGAYIGNPLRDRPGALGGDPDRAIELDGTDAQHVKMQEAVNLPDRAPFTIEAWVWPRRPSETAFDIIADDTGISGLGWFLFSQGNRLKLERADGVASDLAEFVGLATDRYSHVVGTYDGTTLRLYVDGLLQDERSSTRSIPPNASPMKLGAHFPGSLDEVAFYRTALATPRIKLHHDRGRGLR